MIRNAYTASPFAIAGNIFARALQEQMQTSRQQAQRRQEVMDEMKFKLAYQDRESTKELARMALEAKLKLEHDKEIEADKAKYKKDEITKPEQQEARLAEYKKALEEGKSDRELIRLFPEFAVGLSNLLPNQYKPDKPILSDNPAWLNYKEANEAYLRAISGGIQGMETQDQYNQRINKLLLERDRTQKLYEESSGVKPFKEEKKEYIPTPELINVVNTARIKEKLSDEDIAKALSSQQPDIPYEEALKIVKSIKFESAPLIFETVKSGSPFQLPNPQLPLQNTKDRNLSPFWNYQTAK